MKKPIVNVNEAELKFGVYASLPPDADGQPQFFYFMGRHAMSLDYWDDEGKR